MESHSLMEVRKLNGSGYYGSTAYDTVIVEPEEQYSISSITGGKVYEKQETKLILAKFKILVAGYCRSLTDFVAPKDVTSLCESYLMHGTVI